MDDIERISDAKNNGPKTLNSGQRMIENQKDLQCEVGNFFKKLILWREESQKQFFTIVNSHGNSINEAMNNLLKEVSDLHAELSDTRKERNDLITLIESMKITNGKIPQPTVSTNTIWKQQEPNEDTLDRDSPAVGHIETQKTGIEKPMLTNGMGNQEESEDNGALSDEGLHQQSSDERETENNSTSLWQLVVSV